MTFLAVLAGVLLVALIAGCFVATGSAIYHGHYGPAAVCFAIGLVLIAAGITYTAESVPVDRTCAVAS